MKKEKLKEKVEELISKYDIHFESGGSDDFVKDILELFKQEKEKLLEELKLKDRIKIASELGKLEEKIKL